VLFFYPKDCHLDQARMSNATEWERRDPDDARTTMPIQEFQPGSVPGKASRVPSFRPASEDARLVLTWLDQMLNTNY
jgi:hypothetical protein